MALLDEIAGRLAAAGLASSSGAGGWRLYQSWLPDSSALPNPAVAIIETGGYPPELKVEVDHPTFQVLVQGENIAKSSGAYAAARAKAEAIKLNLHGVGGQLLPTSSAAGARYYVEVAALQDPTLIRMDEQQRPLIGCNYKAQRSRT